MKPSERNNGSRTIVVAHDDAGLRQTLIEYLRDGKYNVFEAPDLPTMVEVVLTQTRPIDLLLTDTSMEKRSWARRLQNHRPMMTVWFVENWQDSEIPDVLTPEVVPTKVRAFFASSGKGL